MKPMGACAHHQMLVTYAAKSSVSLALAFSFCHSSHWPLPYAHISAPFLLRTETFAHSSQMPLLGCPGQSAVLCMSVSGFCVWPECSTVPQQSVSPEHVPWVPVLPLVLPKLGRVHTLWNPGQFPCGSYGLSSSASLSKRSKINFP